MEEVRFQTPEDVDVAYPCAGPGTRFIAVCIDQILIFFGLLFLAAGLFMLGFLGDRYLGKLSELASSADNESIIWYVAAIVFLLKFLVDMFYYTFFEMFRGGQTPGKKFMRIQVMQDGGFPLHPAASLVRNTLRIVDNLPPCWIVMLFSPVYKRIGDHVAGTVVVSKARSPAPGASRQFRFYSELGSPRFVFTAEQVSRLCDADLELLESYFERRNGLERKVAHRLRHQISESLRKRMSLPVVRVVGQEDRFLYELRALLLEQSAKRQL